MAYVCIQEQAATKAALVSSTPTNIFHSRLTGIVVESKNDDAATERVLFPWLVEELEQSTKMKRADIVKCVTVLAQEGIDDELILAGVHPDDFNVPYLKSIGITSPGVQQHLLRIHRSLVEQRGAKGVSSSSTAGILKNDNKIVDPAAARKVAALKSEVAPAKEMAREAAQKASEMKSNIDAFMDATGVSAGGQMQRAVRTTDGKAVVVSVAVNQDETHELHDRLDRLEKTNKKR